MHHGADRTPGAAPYGLADHPTIDIYDEAIPGFVAAELERLYENIYTTQCRYTIYNEIAGASTYVKRSGGRVRAVFLFRRQGQVIKVLNKHIALGEVDLAELCAALFAHHRTARKIVFFALQCQLRTLTLPHRQYWCQEDMVLRLPPSVPLYMAALGQKMRYNLRSCERKIMRDFPTFSFTNLDTTAAGEAAVRAIIALAAARMARKGRPAYVNESETRRIVELVAAYGMVGLAWIDGQICGGQICYRVGNNFFMHIVAHDPRYDSHGLGTLILLYTFNECIARGARECSLMAGGNEYKTRFLAAPRDLHSVLVYRSAMQRWLDLGHIGLAARHYRRRVTWALLPLAKGKGRDQHGLARWCAALERAMHALGAVIGALAARWRRVCNRPPPR